MVAFVRIRGIYAKFEDYITAPDEKTPSQLAQTVSIASDMVARSIVAQMKATFMGKASGESRAESGLEFDLAVASNPLLGIALKAVPGLAKTLRKNPQLIDYALSKFGNRKSGPIPDNGNHQTSMTIN